MPCNRHQQRAHQHVPQMKHQYRVRHMLGSGMYGEVYAATDMTTGRTIAMKKVPNEINTELKSEYSVLKKLHSRGQVEGIVKATLLGKDDEETYMIMGRLGKNLRMLCGGGMSVHTLYQLMIMLIRRLEQVHKRGYVYRDMKPENMVMGRGKEKNMLYLIDFGLAKKYRNKKGRHVEKGSVRWETGEEMYWSVYLHEGWEMSRRDDLIMGGYAMVDLFRGLIWEGRTVEDMKMFKQEVELKEVCEGMGKAFFLFMEQVHRLRFDERPDYHFLRGIFRRGLKKRGLREDGVFDWS